MQAQKPANQQSTEKPATGVWQPTGTPSERTMAIRALFGIKPDR